jgi:hypothetical protein
MDGGRSFGGDAREGRRAVSAEAAALIPLLDALRAAERAGAEALERWVASCRDPRLRGGLRVICARDRSHAALAEERLRALGGVPTATANAELQAVCGVVADPGVSDRSKLALLIARLARGVEGTVEHAVRTSAVDVETQAVLSAIGEDDLGSMRWLRAVHDALDGR